MARLEWGQARGFEAKKWRTAQRGCGAYREEGRALTIRSRPLSGERGISPQFPLCLCPE